MKRFTASVERTKSGTFLVRGGIGREPGARKTYHEVGEHEEAIIDGERLVGRSLAKALRDKLKNSFRAEDLGVIDTTLTLEALHRKFIQHLTVNGYQPDYIDNMGSLLLLLKDSKMTTVADILNDGFLEKIEDWKLRASISKKASTIDWYLRLLHAFLKWLKKTKKIHRVPDWEGVSPELPESTAKFFTTDEWLKLDRVIVERGDIQLRIACHLAYKAGLRHAEVTGHRGKKGVLWEDITWLSDGGARLFLRKEIAKNKKHSRTIPLEKDLINLLGARQTGPLCTINYANLFKRFDAARDAAKINEELTFHGLRHSFNKNIIESGNTIKDAGDLSGHRDLAVTQKVYGHLEQRHYDEVIRRVSEYREKEEARARELRVIG